MAPCLVQYRAKRDVRMWFRVLSKQKKYLYRGIVFMHFSTLIGSSKNGLTAWIPIESQRDKREIHFWYVLAQCYGDGSHVEVSAGLFALENNILPPN
jgi:hypothetical protein